MEKHFSKFVMGALALFVLAGLASGCVRNPAPENRRQNMEDDSGTEGEKPKEETRPAEEAPVANDAAAESRPENETGNATGAAAETDAQNGTAEGPAAGSPETTEAAAEPEAALSGPVLQTEDDGVLVRAPLGYTKRSRTWEPKPLASPDRVAEPLAAGIFSLGEGSEPPGGNDYIVWAFPKREDENLEQWSRRSSWGDSSFPDETVITANGKTGIVYETNDLGFAPVVHIMIATNRFVYRIDWDDNRIPKKEVADEEYYEAIRQASEDRESYYTPPAHFLEFVRALEVK